MTLSCLHLIPHSLPATACTSSRTSCPPDCYCLQLIPHSLADRQIVESAGIVAVRPQAMQPKIRPKVPWWVGE